MPDSGMYANNQPSNKNAYFIFSSWVTHPSAFHPSPAVLFYPFHAIHSSLHFDLNTISLSLSPSKPSNGHKCNHFNKTVVNFYIYHCYVWVPLCKNGYAPQSVSCVTVRVNVGAVCEVILHGLWVRWKLCFYGNKCSIVRRSETNTRRIQIRTLKRE